MPQGPLELTAMAFVSWRDRIGRLIPGMRDPAVIRQAARSAQ
jgi:hypothetical protein